jgi:hypothetical protein
MKYQQYQLFIDEKAQKANNELIEEKESESLTSKQSIYRNYLSSVTWKHIREEALKYYNYTCQSCGKEGRDVHHERYPSEWGQETIDDLKVLCRKCHDAAHVPVIVKKVDASARKIEKVHVRAISSFLSDEQTNELQKEYPNKDLHLLFISDTPEGEEARKKAMKILNINTFFLYGLNDFVKKEDNLLTAKESRILHEKKRRKSEKKRIKNMNMIRNHYRNSPSHLRDNKF